MMNHTTDTGLSCARRIQYFGLAMWIYVVLQFVTGFVGALPALLGINTTWLVLLGGTVVAGCRHWLWHCRQRIQKWKG